MLMLLANHVTFLCSYAAHFGLCVVVAQYNKQRILQLENVHLQSVLDETSEYIRDFHNVFIDEVKVSKPPL